MDAAKPITLRNCPLTGLRTSDAFGSLLRRRPGQDREVRLARRYGSQSAIAHHTDSDLAPEDKLAEALKQTDQTFLNLDVPKPVD